LSGRRQWSRRKDELQRPDLSGIARAGDGGRGEAAEAPRAPQRRRRRRRWRVEASDEEEVKAGATEAIEEPQYELEGIAERIEARGSAVRKPR